MSLPSTYAPDPSAPPNTSPLDRFVSHTTWPVARSSAWYTPALSPSPMKSRPSTVHRFGDAPTSVSGLFGLPALNTSLLRNWRDHRSLPVAYSIARIESASGPVGSAYALPLPT